MFKTPPTTARPPRPRLRFTLRLLLSTLTLLCLALGWWTHRAREQRRIVERIRASGGSVQYNYETAIRVIGGPRPRWRGLSPVPRWLLDSLGEDYFHEVVEVNTRDKNVMSELSKFWSLEMLVILDESLTDDDLAPLARVGSLASLTINSERLPDHHDRIPIGDQSLALIGKMPALEYAYINGTQFSAKGLESLARSTSLQTVYVSNCDDSVDSRITELFKKSGRIKRICIRRYIPGSGYRDVVEW